VAEAYRRSQSGASKKFRKLLIDAELTVRQVGAIIRVTPSTISHVIAGDRTSGYVLRSLCELIASKVNRDVLDLFPEYSHLWSPWQERTR
jgi:hypothetical protein